MSLMKTNKKHNNYLCFFFSSLSLIFLSVLELVINFNTLKKNPFIMNNCMVSYNLKLCV